MAILRTLTILVLVGLIFGGSAYFAYELFWKPRQLDREDKIAQETAVAAPPVAPPDYSLPAFEKAMALRQSGDTGAARAALLEFLKSYPDSPRLAEAKKALGEINAEEVFSPSESGGKMAYTVGKGDSLVKIASKLKSNAELIFRVNNMENINLQIGQQLFVPQLDAALVVNRKGGTVTLMNHGEFLKEYPVLSLKIPGSAKAAVQTKVVDKIALQDSKRVAFGDKAYMGSDRWLMLGGGVAVRGMSEGETPPPGIVVSRPDIEEIFLLVSRGTPVTIE